MRAKNNYLAVAALALLVLGVVFGISGALMSSYHVLMLGGVVEIAALAAAELSYRVDS